jgi:hypothetical protein
MTADALRARGHGVRVMLAGRVGGSRLAVLRNGRKVAVLWLDQDDGARIELNVFGVSTLFEPGQHLLVEARVDTENTNDGRAVAVARGDAVVAL